MLNEMVRQGEPASPSNSDIPECSFRNPLDSPMCTCSNAMFSYKGSFNTDFCKTCPIMQKTGFPTLAERLANLAKASAKHLASGLKSANSEEVERRKSICEGCDQYDKEKGLCNKCGCFLNIKTLWATSVCPLGKWET